MKKRPMTSGDLLWFRMVSDPQVSPDGRRVAWVETWIVGEENRYRSRLCLTDVTTGATMPLTAGLGHDTHPRWSPDGRAIAFLSSDPPASGALADRRGPDHPVSVVGCGPQLCLVPAAGGQVQRLTRLYGGAHEPAWSPDGTRLAITTYVDPARGLEQMPDASAGDADDPYARFNRDVLVVTRLRWKLDDVGYFGDYRRHIAVVQVAGPAGPGAAAPVVLLSRGPYELHRPTWSPDGRWLAAAGNTRPDGEGVRESFLYLLDATAAAPLEPLEIFGLAEMRSNALAWSPDGTAIAVCGHNDRPLGHYGNQRLWLVSPFDRSGACLTAGFDYTLGDYSRNADVRGYGGDDGPRWLPDASGLLVLVNHAGMVHLHEVARTGGRPRRLEDGDHATIAFSSDRSCRTIVTLTSDDMTPGDLFVLSREGDTWSRRRLTHVNRDLLDEVELSRPVRFSCPSGDVTVHGWVLPPTRCEPGRRYPMILYNGGGPGSMRASVFCHEWQVYAAAGYAVAYCNTRGNHGYGEAFSAAIRGRWGDLDYEDSMAFLRAACASFDFIDPDRLGVAGGSYGGYLTTWIVARHPEFRAAVSDRCLFNRFGMSGASDIGFLLDQVEFDRRLPWEVPDVYLARSPVAYMAGVRTPTLVVHSAQDLRCPVDQGESLYMALRRLGVPTELVRFPDESHNLSRGGKPWHRIFRIDRYLDWFGRWL
ncbi:MAG: S9 family peptidase [Armatimonadota bacterium]|nr:S9 family peptidase [Armatimonadota bacterium]